MSFLRSLLATLDELRAKHRRRVLFLSPGIERRRPRIAAEDYAARHSIEHTLDRKAELRRMAPLEWEAARRYHELLSFELDGLRQVITALHSATGGRELHECIVEHRTEIERLEIEVAWCNSLLEKWRAQPTG